MKRVALVLLLALGMAHAQQQDEAEPPRTLTPGKGVELATARCVTCHDAQHITRTKLSRGEWEFNIKNMIERGAQIAPHEIAPILEYLATYYNRDVAPPPSAGTGNAGGDPVANLLNAHACSACHQIDKRVVGPSFKEVAAKYGGDGGAAALLSGKIRKGGSGVWGAAPMPPNATLSESDLQQLVSWILQQK
jgi:cytochrome c